MERLRRRGREMPSAATERLLLAVTLSLGLHAFLLHQYASHFQPSARPGLSVISARIADSTPAPPLAAQPYGASPHGSRAHGAKPSQTPQQASGRQLSPSPPALPVAEPAVEAAAVDGPVIGEPRQSEPQSNSPRAPEPAAVKTATPASDLPDPIHYPAKELDVYPRLLGPLVIDYPEAAGEQAGRVVLLLLVDESGRVSGVSVVDAQPEGVYEDAVTRAYSGAAFSPAWKDGRNVRSRILVAVEIEAPTRADGE